MPSYVLFSQKKPLFNSTKANSLYFAQTNDIIRACYEENGRAPKKMLIKLFPYAY